MTGRYTVLVVAKAPVAGQAKTRLCPPASPEGAADLAAAALLDTLDAVLATSDTVPMVALIGDLGAAARGDELTRVLRRCTVLPQRGDDFAQRLANAHADTARAVPGQPVVQIGMDTPQVTPVLLAAVAAGLAGCDAVLGPATDGGWWALGLREPRHAEVLSGVGMSRPDTAEQTLRALESAGLRTGTSGTLSDVDSIQDAEQVSAVVPESRFSAALEAITQRTGSR